jgi:hypothetical protein
VIPWSFSLLSDFANCRWKVFRKYVSKDLPKEPQSPELAEGIRMHSLLERAIKSRTLVELAAPLHPVVQPMTQNGATAEHMLGMTEDRQPAKFFGSPWGRGKIDVLILKPPVAVIFDWKTGKVREDPRELACHALLIKANFPAVEKITGAYVWLKENRLGTPYDLSNTDRVYHGTRATVAEMEECQASGVWEKKPNPLCGWCPVKDCEHNRS